MSWILKCIRVYVCVCMYHQNKYMFFFVSSFHKHFLCIWDSSLVKTSHKTKHYYYNLETSSSICDSERFVFFLCVLCMLLRLCFKRWQQKSNKIFLMWYTKKNTSSTIKIVVVVCLFVHMRVLMGKDAKMCVLMQQY